MSETEDKKITFCDRYCLANG